MNFTFYKYQGTGNDFVMIDNRTKIFPNKETDKIAKICDRHFGIGADGLILLENDNEADFKMVYYNADGNESTMCGNGGRCIVAFAKKLGIIDSKTTFNAIDGLHKASINNDIVSLKMIDVEDINVQEGFTFLDTGSPHHIEVVTNLNEYPVFEKGRKIRNEVYGIKGSNVNFIEPISDSSFRIRTYERGVENETLACGTGVTAAAIAMHKNRLTSSTKVTLIVEGGTLEVDFDVDGSTYKNVILSGPATFVFKGNITV
ncbi:MAG: diaminopimelate epimerase [Flavobacteriaceae bacterium]